MKAEELFEIYKGKEFSFYGYKCIVCGHAKSPDTEPQLLIIAFMENVEFSWKELHHTDTAVTHENNANGFWYMSEAELNLYL